MDSKHTACLLVAGSSSAAIALLHVAVTAIGAPAYRYFGAGESLASHAQAGSLFPAGLTLMIAGVFAGFSAYAFSGAGVIRRLPLIRTGLVTIAAIYLLRGLSAIPQGLALVLAPGSFPSRYFVFSFVSLCVGTCYAWGAQKAWTVLGES